MKILKNLHNVAQDFQKKADQLEKVEAVFSWISSGATAKDSILFISEAGREMYHFTFPRRAQDVPIRKKKLSSGEKITFIINALPLVPEEVSSGGAWNCIYRSWSLEVFESADRFSTMAPLRWGLTAEEKKEAMILARKVLKKFLMNGTTFLDHSELSNLSQRFFTHGDVEVAIWVNGQPRGAVIRERLWLYEGIASAVVAASSDGRFKPLTAEELPATTIEIFILSTLKIPLTKFELTSREFVDSDKGFVAAKGSKKGWFLPGVLNVSTFRDFQDFLNRLTEEKLGISNDFSDKLVRISDFEVEHFVEAATPDGYITVGGDRGDEIDSFNIESAINWLRSMQEPDGNVMATIYPLLGSTRQFDLIRSSFAFYALAEYAASRKLTELVSYLEKHIEYARVRIYDPLGFKPVLAFAYIANESYALYRITKKEDHRAFADLLVDKIKTHDFSSEDPISIQNCLSLLAKQKSSDRDFEEPISKLIIIAKEQFYNGMINGQESLHPINFVELINSFRILGDIQKIQEHYDFAFEVLEMLLSFYNERSATNPFTISRSGGDLYSAAAGKILEILPHAEYLAKKTGHNPDKYGKIAVQLYAWLAHMQYSESNLYFVKTEFRPAIAGACRHSRTETSARVDATGHVLLYLSKQHGK